MCLWIDDDGDYTDLRSGFRTARKEHACTECHRTIEPSERYFYQTAIDQYAETIVTWKMCGHCRTLITVGAKAAGCPEAWYWEMVLDRHEEGYSFMLDIIEHDFGPGVRFRLLRYWTLARRQWRTRRGELAPLPEAIAA